MTRAEKAAATARSNGEKRRQMEIKYKAERDTIKRSLLSVLDNPDASPAEKIQAAELLKEYHI